MVYKILTEKAQVRVRGNPLRLQSDFSAESTLSTNYVVAMACKVPSLAPREQLIESFNYELTLLPLISMEASQEATIPTVSSTKQLFLPKETFDHPFDVTLAIQDGKEFKAHRRVLSEASPFFERLPVRKNAR